VPLWDDRAAQPLAPVVVVALAAREVQLTFTAVEQLAAPIEEGLQLGIAAHRDRQPA